MIRLKTVCVSLFFLLVSSTAIFSEQKNLIYIVVEGTSRQTLYALLNKQALPSFSEIAERGNYRNMDGESIGTLNASMAVYLHSNGGYLGEGMQSGRDVKLFLSSPVNGDYPDQLEEYLNTAIKQTGSEALDYKTSQALGQKVSRYLDSKTEPFFLLLNYTNVDYIGKRYREGAELYSQALKNCDKSLGMILAALRRNDLYEKTEFFITTNYGYLTARRDPVAESWVISSQPILRKGDLGDIFPSLVGILDEVSLTEVKTLSGSSLFDERRYSDVTASEELTIE